MSVKSVPKPFARSQTSGHMRELIQVSKLTTASNVERLFVASHILANIKIFTEDKHCDHGKTQVRKVTQKRHSRTVMKNCKNYARM